MVGSAQAPRSTAARRAFPAAAAPTSSCASCRCATCSAKFDRILTPCEFARDRYLAVGYPARQVQVMPNGIAAAAAAPHRTSSDGRRDRFGFFGHVNRFKGGLVLLEASSRLSAEGVGHAVTLHGGAAYQSESFMEAFKAGLSAAPAARHRGPYGAAELPGLMAQVDWVVVPSVWWENAPLVVQ